MYVRIDYIDSLKNFHRYFLFWKKVEFIKITNGIALYWISYELHRMMTVY